VSVSFFFLVGKHDLGVSLRFASLHSISCCFYFLWGRAFVREIVVEASRCESDKFDAGRGIRHSFLLERERQMAYLRQQLMVA
jgi:hypothetical protein